MPKHRRLDRIPIWKEGEPLPITGGAMPYNEYEFYDALSRARIGDAVPIPVDVNVHQFIAGKDVDDVMTKVQDYAPSSETELTQSVSLRVWIAKMINGMTLDELGFVRAAVDLVLKEKRK
jgi:hypothetical protein